MDAFNLNLNLNLNQGFSQPSAFPGLGAAPGMAGQRCCPCSGADPMQGLMQQQMMQSTLMMQQMMMQMMQLLTTLLSGSGQNSGASAVSPAGAATAGGSSPAGASGSQGSQGASGSQGTNASLGALPANNTKDLGSIKDFIKKAAGAYGADAGVLTGIAQRESNFRADAVNNWDSNAKKGTPSKGMFQFIEPTFKAYAAQARKANPKAWEGLGELNWLDWRQQALATAWAIKNGKGSAWATYRAAGGR